MKTKKPKQKISILLLTIALVAVLLTGCKKDNANPNDNSNSAGSGYFMRFKINGTTAEFTTQASLVAAFGQAGTIFNGAFTGYSANSNMVLQVYDDKAITTKTFSGYNIVGSSIIGAIISYQDVSGTVFTQGFGTSNATVTITEMTAKIVRGTFSGTLSSSGKADVSVTNGEFYVWRAN